MAAATRIQGLFDDRGARAQSSLNFWEGGLTGNANHGLSGDLELAPALTASAKEGDFSIIDGVADEWRDLCANGEGVQPFYRPEWIRAYVRAFLPRAKVHLVTVRRGDDLQAVLPLVAVRESFCGLPCMKLRSPVKGHAFRFDMTCAAGERETAIAAVWRELCFQRDWQILEFRNVLPGAAVERLLELAASEGYPTASVPLHASPYVALGNDPAILAKLPRNARLRTKLRQVARNVGGQGLRLRRIEQADPDALKRFYELEAQGWKGREGSAISSSAESRQFFDEVAGQAERFGYLCLYLLECGDGVLAGHFGLSYAGRYFSPKVAFDESRKDWMGGHLIVSQILQDCLERGISEYDITGSDDEWKMKWTSDVRPARMLLIFQNNSLGRILHAWQFRAKPLIKRMLGGQPRTS